jgi:hypothetical protein
MIIYAKTPKIATKVFKKYLNTDKIIKIKEYADGSILFNII